MFYPQLRHQRSHTLWTSMRSFFPPSEYQKPQIYYYCGNNLLHKPISFPFNPPSSPKQEKPLDCCLELETLSENRKKMWEQVWSNERWKMMNSIESQVMAGILCHWIVHHLSSIHQLPDSFAFFFPFFVNFLVFFFLPSNFIILHFAMLITVFLIFFSVICK